MKPLLNKKSYHIKELPWNQTNRISQPYQRNGPTGFLIERKGLRVLLQATKPVCPERNLNRELKIPWNSPICYWPRGYCQLE